MQDSEARQDMQDKKMDKIKRKSPARTLKSIRDDRIEDRTPLRLSVFAPLRLMELSAVEGSDRFKTVGEDSGVRGFIQRKGAKTRGEREIRR